MRFTSGISEDVLIKMFNAFHEEMTGHRYYAVGDPIDEPWRKFRESIILNCATVLIDDRKEGKADEIH